MSSAAIPAFLLARRVTGSRWPAYLLAVVSVAMPWIVYSTVLADRGRRPIRCSSGRCFAMHRSITSPRWSNDLVALLVIALAFFARTQFALLAGRSAARRRRGRPRSAERRLLADPHGRGAARRPSAATSSLVCFYVPLVLAASRLPHDGGRPQPSSASTAARPRPRSRPPRHAGASDGPRRRPRLRDGDPAVRRRHGLAARRRRAALGGDADARVRLRRDRRRCW